jgi:hypothetical protein
LPQLPHIASPASRPNQHLSSNPRSSAKEHILQTHQHLQQLLDDYEQETQEAQHKLDQAVIHAVILEELRKNVAQRAKDANDEVRSLRMQLTEAEVARARTEANEATSDMRKKEEVDRRHALEQTNNQLSKDLSEARQRGAVIPGLEASRTSEQDRAERAEQARDQLQLNLEAEQQCTQLLVQAMVNL